MSFLEPVVDAGVALGVTKIALDSVTRTTRGSKSKRGRGKYVVVSGRSSHTVTASSPSEARKVFSKRFPYAKVKYVSKVRQRMDA
jgi:hypothetical protein